VEPILNETIAIQQIPSPTWGEERLARYVENRFTEMGYADVFKDQENNVYARIKGGKNPPIVVSAHMDTVFDLSCDLRVTRQENKLYGPGIGDNSLGVACLVLMGPILESLSSEPDGDIILVANVCEEGTGDLKGMRAAFDRTIQEGPLAYIVLEGTSGTHCIYTKGVGSRRYKITAHGQGGHSWNDFGNSSAIHSLVKLGAQIADLSPMTAARSAFNIGVINGGISINTIAQTAYFLLDLRSETREGLDDLINQTQTILNDFSMDHISITAEQIGDRPTGEISESAPLIKLCHSVFLETGFNAVQFKSGSTDANIPFSKNIPAVCIGIADGEDVHTPGEYLITDSLDRAIEKVGKIISRVWQIASC
jgi:acetylornithine deacetylase/succinyl-diaminopimelate desuccinylase-like protein